MASAKSYQIHNYLGRFEIAKTITILYNTLTQSNYIVKLLIYIKISFVYNYGSCSYSISAKKIHFLLNHDATAFK